MLGDLKQLRAFLAIARLGNFTRAAYELNISQSALTIQIQQLETHLRTQLFDRNRRSVTLTPHGQELFPASNAWLPKSKIWSPMPERQTTPTGAR